MAATSDQQQQPRPYQGVRVKEPVKELLKRKRGSTSSTNATPAATVILPHQTLSTYSTIDQSCIDMNFSTPSLPISDDGALYAGWISQPSPTALQPLSQWATCPEYVPHEAVTCPYTADMYVQPVCPSYAVVGPSSVLTYTSQPLLTNFTQPRSTSIGPMPPLELTDQQAPLTYFPWAQPISTLPMATLQYPSPTNTLAGPQFVPLPISIPELAPQDLEEARRVISCTPIEKLLQEDEDNDTILHICAAKGMREFSLAAAERMADLRRLDVKEHKGKTPLLVAVTARQPAIVRDLILAGADVHAVDNKGQSALHLAATYGYPEVIQVIAAFALPVNIEMKDFEGHTPLHCAVLAHNSVLREQREGPGLTPTQQDELEPRSRELKACIHLLVQMGALVSSQDLKSSKTVLHYAVQDANLPLLKFFLELEMHKPSKLVNNQAHGNTALHMAAALYHEPQQEEIIRLLLKHGADPSARNLENDQAIHLVQAGETGDRVNLTLADKL